MFIIIVVGVAAVYGTWVNDVRKRPGLSADAQAVWAVVETPKGELGRGYSVGELAERTGLSPNAIQAAVDELDDRRLAARSPDGLIWSEW